MPVSLPPWGEGVLHFRIILSGTFREHSDIDLAVSGLPREHIYKMESKTKELLGRMHFCVEQYQRDWPGSRGPMIQANDD